MQKESPQKRTRFLRKRWLKCVDTNLLLDFRSLRRNPVILTIEDTMDLETSKTLQNLAVMPEDQQLP